LKSAVVALAGALVLVASAALAALSGPMQHPWKITHEDGSSFVVTFHDDGTYTTDGPIHGTWAMKGKQMCVTRSTGESNCMDYKADAKPGDSYKSEDAAKKPVTITILN